MFLFPLFMLSERAYVLHEMEDRKYGKTVKETDFSHTHSVQPEIKRRVQAPFIHTHTYFKQLAMKRRVQAPLPHLTHAQTCEIIPKYTQTDQKYALWSACEVQNSESQMLTSFSWFRLLIFVLPSIFLLFVLLLLPRSLRYKNQLLSGLGLKVQGFDFELIVHLIVVWDCFHAFYICFNMLLHDAFTPFSYSNCSIPRQSGSKLRAWGMLYEFIVRMAIASWWFLTFFLFRLLDVRTYFL